MMMLDSVVEVLFHSCISFIGPLLGLNDPFSRRYVAVGKKSWEKARKGNVFSTSQRVTSRVEL